MKLPSAPADSTRLEPFWYWINERERIYQKRLKGARAPWTQDPVLQQFRFCNVFRENDKVTAWIRENWREPYAKHKNLWFAMCVARQINKIETLQKLGFPEDLSSWMKRTRKLLKGMAERKEKIYGGAYIITNANTTCPKWQFTCDLVFKGLLGAGQPAFARGAKVSLQTMWQQLLRSFGFGPFIAYEVVSDLRWTRYYDGSDHNLWANAGPGAKRGVGRLFYGDPKAKVSPEECLTKMRLLLSLSRKRVPGRLGKHVSPLELRDIEHSLCEVDKYLRATNNEGRMKQKYKGGQA